MSYRICHKCGGLKGGVHLTPEAFQAWIDKKWDAVLEQPFNLRRQKFREIFRVDFPQSMKSPIVLVGNNKNDTLEFTNWTEKKRDKEYANGSWTVKLIPRAFTEINRQESYYHNLPRLTFTGNERNPVKLEEPK
jgi:hypothetical protein